MTTKLETYAISHENSSNELIRETPYSAQETVNSQQLAILKKNFPSCFDKNGAFLPNKLAELVGTETEVSQEFYELNWLGRSYAKYLRNAPPEMLMTEDTEHNAEPINQDSQNLLIQGDNLEVLKHLKNAYAEQVKMIYIDPPYNTGSDGFVYQDDRKFTPQQLSELANVPIEEAERILAFTAKGSNSHSAWLTFMYPRLYVARELLKDDGVIFISIDDNEQAQLKLLCDDVFGEENFIANVAWKHTEQSKNDEKYFSRQYNSLLVYRCSDSLEKLRMERQEIDNKNYSNPDNDPNGDWRSGDVRSPNYRHTLCFDITTPSGKIIKSPENGWRWSKESIEEKIKSGEIIFSSDEKRIIRKIYLNNQNGRVPENLWQGEEFGTTRIANNQLKILFDNKTIFDTPKPYQLIMKILGLFYQTDSNFIVLDFFAGSGTTAHAVMQLNAEDGGNRQFIAVQIAEPTDSKSEAFKAGYHTIFDITKERIIRASQKIREENPQATGDFGFKIYKTTPHLINHNLAFDLNQPELPELLELKPDDYLALLTTWRLYDGAKLTEKVTDIDLDGYTAHLCQQNLYLMYPDFQPKHLIQLIKLLDNDPSFTPNRVVMLGETIDSSRQNEIYQALKDYANKKSLDLSVIVRNI
jgi:adenine-specific DNA-methyltransferase